ncbi:MAG: hypothetical protein HFE83_06605 [Lachnospiraceae bacterium]|nr:hypothetical protein [Lachnospiraceae bacterium]
MNDKELKLTDLDYAIGNHHLQMMKAALPYMQIGQQRAMSMFIKWNELMRTMNFFRENDEGMLSVCSLDEDHVSPNDMLSAVRPYANEREQELIDILSRFLQTRGGRMGANGQPGKNPGPFPIDQLLSIMPQEQRSRFETIQLMMQALNAG